MDEDLLGYLIGALEPHEMRKVEERLRRDPSAREELERLERMLRPLDEASSAEESPPPDLVSRTLANLPPLPDPTEPRWDSGPAQPAPSDVGGLTPMGRALESGSNSSRRWVDGLVAVVASVTVLGLLLPSLAEGRFEARRVACQNQLRELGTAITEYVNRSEQQRLPAVAANGPEAFAGIYSVRLHDAGLLSDGSLRWCPSWGRPEESSDQLGLESLPFDVSLASVTGDSQPGRIDHRTPKSHQSNSAATRLVSAATLHQASVNQLQALQRLMGGHYAYSLGVIDGKQYQSPRFQARSSFAVLSDAPLGGDLRNGLKPSRVAHGGRGINVLYESGRVQFIPLQVVDTMPDHPLLNMRGEVEAGVNIDDAVLAPSWRAPFLDAPQR